MAVCNQHHKELNESGEGKCSVPMWMDGVPAGFCDEPAYGEPTKSNTYRDYYGEIVRVDGKYSGYVPFFACPGHGGPKVRGHFGDPCKYCGTPHDDVKPGACPGKAQEQ